MTSTCDDRHVGPDQIVARLKAIRDARMRVLLLVEAFREGDPMLWVQVLATIVNRAHVVDDADAIEALESITHAAADPALSYETRQSLYEAASDLGLAAIARLFLATAAPATEAALAPERPLKPTGRPLTLGERKALARTNRRDQILLLTRDPHPAVIAILLGNPHVTEADIVRIAAARPGVPASLAAIAAHPRWSVRHAVKRALVLNPATPLADAIRIATTLRRNELEEIAADPALPEQLRRHAADVCVQSQRRPRA